VVQVADFLLGIELSRLCAQVRWRIFTALARFCDFLSAGSVRFLLALFFSAQVPALLPAQA
jgi:hypothetical protein